MIDIFLDNGQWSKFEVAEVKSIGIAFHQMCYCFLDKTQYRSDKDEKKVHSSPSFIIFRTSQKEFTASEASIQTEEPSTPSNTLTLSKNPTLGQFQLPAEPLPLHDMVIQWCFTSLFRRFLSTEGEMMP